MLQGRALGFRVSDDSSELATSPPFKRVQTVGQWSSWRRDGAWEWATTRATEATSLPEAWGLLFPI